MSIEALVVDPARRSFAGQPEADLLTERDALQEADLVAFRVNTGLSRLEALFDLRQALQFREANTAVLVADGLGTVEWSGAGRQPFRRMAHPVMSSVPGHGGGRVRLALACLPDVRLTIEAASAEFFVGTIPWLPDAPPNFAKDDEATITAGMPAWSSAFEPGWATFLDPEPD